ncbi:MAG: hypothetical protein Ta2A_07900 [Treponemataceae bacterium]|nr:MAG: hypothetical protein Ta2A_07900 [Treponemataceae bacterium]
MKRSPLLNMIPLDGISMEKDFKDICEYIYEVSHCSGFNNKNINSSLKKGIQEVLRIYGHKFKPTRISEKAYLFCENEIKNNLLESVLYKKWYKNRKQYYPLFLEHIVPLGSIIERIRNCNSPNESEIILSELEFVIILNEENKVLENKGYRSKGRETLEKAEKTYKECNIIIKKYNRLLKKQTFKHIVLAHFA